MPHKFYPRPASNPQRRRPADLTTRVSINNPKPKFVVPSDLDPTPWMTANRIGAGHSSKVTEQDYPSEITPKSYQLDHKEKLQTDIYNSTPQAFRRHDYLISAAVLAGMALFFSL